MLHKPEACKLCPLRSVSFGFCFDQFKESPKIVVVQDMPSKETLTNGEAGTSGQERAWFHSLFETYGLAQEELAWSYIIRCGMNEFPTGWKTRQAVSVCRQYDRAAQRNFTVFSEPTITPNHIPANVQRVTRHKVGLAAFQPTMFLVTEDFGYLRSDPAITRILWAHCKKAVEFTQMGQRVLLLAGKEPMAVHAPHLQGGGARKWMGHFESMEAR